ncbi:type IV toxin-antitoxin system AbiEi family antitoxin domain-containing protein [Actinoplanes sp. GCM10030250]|uniref:type IV toxin-antitoxin system AbiEi family antitoxin domain-containing protein n=1 Tax=Actinoplanes sp. GCM10030250 TaxID=3273376 RepID=UPI003620185B
MTQLDEISRRQRGVVTRSQALRTGLSVAAVRHRLESGRWQRLSGGTYATFTGEVPRSALRWAAVLRAGAGAVLSHGSAAEEVGLVEEPKCRIHITIPEARRIRAPSGLVVHRSRQIRKRRHPTRRPPQTRVEETVLDLALTATSDETAMAWIAAACGRRLTTPERVAKALAGRLRVPRRRDVTALLDDAETGCRSVLEWRYLRDVERAHDLPVGERQRRRSREGVLWYDDVHYVAFGVLVELDGRAAHPTDQRWRDFRRDNAAVQGGEVVLRYGAADISERGCAVAGQVAKVLRSRGWRGLAAPCSPGCDTADAIR